MSTFPQPESGESRPPNQDPLAGQLQSPFVDDDLCTEVTSIERAVTELEPRARHLNRRFVEFFGPHPSSSDGSWVFLVEGDDGSFRFAFEPLELRHVFRLESLFDEVRDLLRDNDIAGGAGGRSASDVGALVVGDAARLRSVPPIHVRVERRQ